ncbi:hypothetical protein ACFQY4_33470 [Catellatospora bangladeshensis]|uniref:hypothetical protein n=1 Tax=Catellatospora bangladeshensis TaxID=310355 RepID=UPI00194046B4|nr:hypothetical protein [Catellatospora bangladeshensis]
MVRRVRHILDAPGRLSPRARAYLAAHGVRHQVWTADQHRRHWHRQGRPDAAIEPLAEFQMRWGGLALPPTAEYDGGPRLLDAAALTEHDGFAAGPARGANAYTFRVDGQGRFGIHGGDAWVPLHGSVDGWVEAAALGHLAAALPADVGLATGPRVDELPERYGLRRVREVDGLADEWWHGDRTLLAVHRGEARLFGNPAYQTAYLYTGIDDLAGHLRAG